MAEDDAPSRRGRALLAAYRAETGPTAAQADRLLAAVHRGAAAGDEEPGEPVVTRIRRGDGGRARAAVVAAGLLAAAVLVAFAWLGGQAHPTPRGEHDAAADQAKDDAGGGQVIDAAPRRPTAAPETAAPATAAPADDPGVETRRGRPASPARREVAPAETTPAPAPSPDPLTGELAFVREVHALLAAGDPARALARVDEYPRRHEAGLLREEVAALRVIAGCGLRRDSEAAAAFERAHPRSLFAGRVRRACEATNETADERTPTSRTYP